MALSEPIRYRHSSALCVAIHDVAPDTWPQCARWLQAIRAVGDFPVSLLVVPNYHRRRVDNPARFEHMLDQSLALGNELVLHGYSHLDEGPRPGNVWNKIVRRIYTSGEGEFSAIDTAEAKRRLDMGVAWFDRNRWPVNGFVAPAWLLGEGGWTALQGYPFKYTTTLRRFYFMPERAGIFAPSLVYSVKNAWRRHAWRAANLIACHMNRNTPLIRLGLHPGDIAHADIVRQSQQILEKLLEYRTAMTKASFAQMWREDVQHDSEKFI